MPRRSTLAVLGLSFAVVLWCVEYNAISPLSLVSLHAGMTREAAEEEISHRLGKPSSYNPLR